MGVGVEMDKSMHRVIIIQMKYIVGIDEAGRGPLAGPVSIGAVRINTDFNKQFFKGIKDSKKLTEEKRETWFERLKAEKKNNQIDFAVALISEKIIDRKGIVYALNSGIGKCLIKLKAPKNSKIFLDGAIKAPKKFKNQRTVIRGDEKISIISLASICAKVTRDRYMVKLSKKYPEYNFHIHKGYGTLAHRKAIRKHGPSAIHRKSFLKNIRMI
jgi:ribonuclease HII